MIRNTKTNLPRLSPLELLERDRQEQPTLPKFKAPTTRKVMCTRGTAKLRYAHKKARKAGGRYS